MAGRDDGSISDVRRDLQADRTMSRLVYIPTWTGTRRIWRVDPPHQPFADPVRVVCDSLVNAETGLPNWQFCPRSMMVDVPKGARLSDPDTSHQAAAIGRDIAGNHRLVLQLLADKGPLTDWALSEHAAQRGIKIVPTSIGKRRQELLRVGFVANSGRRAPTGTGATAICWQITQAGRNELNK